MSSKSSGVGSLAYRSHKQVRGYLPRGFSWGARRPLTPGNVGILGFVGFKVGCLTAKISVDNTSVLTTVGRSKRLGRIETKLPVTIVECPDMVLVAIMYYRFCELRQAYHKVGQTNTANIAPFRSLRNQRVYSGEFDRVAGLFLIQRRLVQSIDAKRPITIEIPVSGTLQEQNSFLIERLGSTFSVENDFTNRHLDVIGCTIGRGFSGTMKRYHHRRLSHKSRKKIRAIANQGSKSPKWTHPHVPAAGRLGNFQRTQFNNYVLTRLTPQQLYLNEGYPHYGIPNNNCLIIRGILPGARRNPLILRDSLRPRDTLVNPEYIGLMPPFILE